MKQDQKKAIEFHISRQDYFGTLATLLFALQEAMGGTTTYTEAKKVLRRTTKDLMYLQKHFKIEKK